MAPQKGYAPVAPPNIIQLLYEEQEHLAGSYHLVLAHDIINDPQPYVGLYQQREPHHFVILDNSAAELLKPLSPDELFETSALVRADAVVVPDVMAEMEQTLDLSAAFMDQIPAHRSFSCMFVPQGKNLEEFKLCVQGLYKMRPEGYMWAVPRHLASTHGSRKPFIDALLEIDSSTPIHLLGFSQFLSDDIMCANTFAQVVGIDSAVPIYLGHMGLRLSLADYAHPGRGDYWNAARERHTLTPEIIANVNQVHRWLR